MFLPVTLLSLTSEVKKKATEFLPGIEGKKGVKKRLTKMTMRKCYEAQDKAKQLGNLEIKCKVFFVHLLYLTFLFLFLFCIFITPKVFFQMSIIFFP